MNERLIGFTFPFRIEHGGVSSTKDFTKIEQNMSHLLATRLGERVMLRTYGGGVHQYTQDPNDDVLRALIKHEIEQALRIYMPEVRLTTPIQVTGQEETLQIVINYIANPRDVIRQLIIQLP